MILFRLIANGLAPLTLLAAVLAYFFPQLFLIFDSVFIWLFAATMFALGIVLEQQELITTLKKPQQIVLGVFTQYTIMPVLAFLLVSLAGLPPALALGFIIVGCAPGAMASNVIVYLAGGAMAFSIAMTTLATFLSPLLTPALSEWLGGQLVPVPFLAMLFTILKAVVAPLMLGMLLRRFINRHIDTAKEIAPAIASLSIIIICAFAVAKNQQQISHVGLEVFALVVILNALGYSAGWYMAKLYRFDQRHRLTLAIEIGMQNAGMGVVLALKHFPDTPETALPGALFAVWCIITAAGATAWLRHKAKHPSQLITSV